MKRRAFVRSTFAAALGAPLLGQQSFFRAIPQDPGDVEAITGDGEEITLNREGDKGFRYPPAGPSIARERRRLRSGTTHPQSIL